MKPTLVLAAIALLAAGASHAAPGGDHRRGHRDEAAGYEHGMHAVLHNAAAGEPGHGWRYFSNPAAQRAVVISPNGEYYFSGGDGLRLVATTQLGA